MQSKWQIKYSTKCFKDRSQVQSKWQASCILSFLKCALSAEVHDVEEHDLHVYYNSRYHRVAVFYSPMTSFCINFGILSCQHVHSLTIWSFETNSSLPHRNVYWNISNFFVLFAWSVAAVPDGLKAWEVLKGRPHDIDLILTEVELPSISGFALLTLIMEHEICKNIPVISMNNFCFSAIFLISAPVSWASHFERWFNVQFPFWSDVFTGFS